MYQGKYQSDKPAAASAPRQKKPAKKGTIVFYSCYAAFVLLFIIGVFCLLNPLDNWLVKFEASQPEAKCEEVFSQLFESKDWEQLYTLAGITDTEYEGKEAFVSFMDRTYGDAQLRYSETSAGLSGDKKYIVHAGDEKLATYTLTNTEESEVAIPNWQLDTVELFFQRNESVHIVMQAGSTAYVNGVALTEDHMIRKTTTLAENYLPEGVHGLQTVEFYLDGLLGAPQVSVKDAAGNEAELTYSADSNTYHENSVVAQEAPEELQQRALDCAEAISRYMIKDILYKNQLQAVLGKGKVADVVAAGDRWVNQYSKFEFKNESCSDYYRYTEDLFSIHVYTETHIDVVKDGTTRIIEQDLTLFFQLNDSGDWVASDMTNINVQDTTDEVRLFFMQDGTVLDDSFVSEEDNSYVAPIPTVPEGKIFAGWCKEEVTEEGTTWSLVFQPSEDGTIDLTAVADLEPMVLYPLFEDKEAA